MLVSSSAGRDTGVSQEGKRAFSSHDIPRLLQTETEYFPGLSKVSISGDAGKLSCSPVALSRCCQAAAFPWVGSRVQLVPPMFEHST